MRLSMQMKMRTRDSKRKALSIQLSAFREEKRNPAFAFADR